MNCMTVFIRTMSLLFTGSGFKIGPVVGQILSQMVTGQSLGYDIDAFRASRFKTSKY